MIRFAPIVVLAVAAGTLAGAQKPDPGPASLQGTWVVESINGKPAPEGAPALTLTFTGDTYQQAIGADVNERGRFTLDASRKPMTIDLVITEGSDSGKTQLGVIELSGDTMRANFDAPGAGQRPPDFSVNASALLVVARKKKG